MNVPYPVILSASFRGARLLFPAALAAALVGSAQTVPSANPPEAKTHVLFMGADISLERNKEFVHVRDVEGGSFVLDIKGQHVTVPMDRSTISMRVDPALKLTESSAQVANLKVERVYTPENDPVKKFAREQPGTSGGAAAGAAGNQAMGAQIGMSMARMGGQGASGPGAGMAQAAIQGAQARVDSTSGSFDNALMASQSDFNNIGEYAGKMQEELEKKLFDAMELTFEVSSEKTLHSPYVVIIATYQEKDGRPGEYKNWIYAQSLDPVGSVPHKVHIKRGGFPPGFEMKDYQVHLYNKGTELATNIAPKRVALTRNEAFQYVRIEYISGHKNATLPAVPAMGKLPADLRTRLASGQYAEAFYVKVSKDGQALDAYVDESCSRKADDPYVIALVKAIGFKPALDKGKPVEGISRLKLSELSL